MSSPVVYHGLDHIPSRPCVVTIGTFDGVHRGHRQLLSRTIDRAAELGLPALALTFEPVPAAVLRPDRFPGRICSPEERLRQLGLSGIEEIAVVPFDIELSKQAPEVFMADVAAATGLRELWVGEAFALGKDRVGNVQRLTEIGRELGFGVAALPRVTDGGEVVSSSAIRSAIAAGDATTARRLLGRPFRVTGEVIHGQRLGRTIGYPTANVRPPASLVPLADGIYASTTILPGDGVPRPAMTYVGTRPTVNGGERLVETHLFDFSGDLYDQVIDVDVYLHLRGDAVFAGLDELVAQMQRDERAARAFFAGRDDWQD